MAGEKWSDQPAGRHRVVPSGAGVGVGTVLDVSLDFRLWQRILIYAGVGLVTFFVYKLLKRILAGQCDDRSE